MSSPALEGVHAVITGGAGGIGLAIARRLDRMGASMTLVGRDRGRLDRALGGLQSANDHAAFDCDVGDEGAVAELFRALDAQGRAPAILVNNAGIAASAALADTTAAMWNETLRINLTGVFHCARAALPALLRAPFARIVNIASTAGLIGYSHLAAYCATKHGVVGFTRALALELARTRVTVNAVCPGYTETAMVEQAVVNVISTTGRSEDQAREALMRRNPQRRLIAPDEVGATVAWLCLPESQSINGQAISLSGGEVMT